ncbi:hypothetical protein K388_05999 [Streptomyces sp. KhCrAH-43]|uniref:hypothetical protein n=1 Tax=unclassified Streptomyces TaxID=2593676 RepID=UPI0003A17B26|nr:MULTISPECIES: hypothetical protein [unclassified Streptomyces]RAJ52899.1 hypothetical protein K388_05999 [Streptomyces sp. KhCrAH-43]
MTEPGNPTVTWAERMELLKDSAQQRVLTAPMPPAAMEQLIADEKAAVLGRFEGSPVRYMDRWWRHNDEGWVALDEAGSTQLDLHAERYRAATAATATEATPRQADADPDGTQLDRTETGAV